MDVIKKQLSVLVLYQFWILSGLVFIVAATVFYLTSSSLNTVLAARTSKLNSTFDQISTVSGTVSSHPNTFSHAVMDKAAAELEVDIKKAWKNQYNYQIPLMVWPRDAFSDASTHTIFSTLRPVEKYIDFPLPARLPPPYDKITLNDRNVYKQYIGREFLNVSRIMDTEWKASLTAADSAEAASSSASLQTDVVRWSKESQQTLLGQIVPWYNKGQAPSILDIYYTQEDMWLLSGIMKIIKKANGDARENFQTVVREVEFIRMGQFASRSAGVLTQKASATAGGYGMGSPDSGGMGMGSTGGSGMSTGSEMGSGSSGEGSGGGVADASVAMDPADNRYISFASESEFQPRKGAELRESIRTVTAANAVDAVAKRVAIRMRLKVDPAGLSRLITACGNAELLLEVYQVRVNTEAAPDMASAGAGGYGSSYGGGGRPGMGGSGMGMGMGGGSSSSDYEGGSGGGYGTTAATVEDTSTEISVEIFGLIYLYNPDNIVSLSDDLAVEKISPAPSTNAPTNTDAAPTEPAAQAPGSDAAGNAVPAVVDPSTAPAVETPPVGAPPASPTSDGIPAAPIGNN